MILCVPGPRALLPAAPSSEAPRGMRASPAAAAPPSAACLQSAPPPPAPPLWDPTKDLRAIASNFCYLESSGWYWGAITAAQAHSALQGESEGAFLVRDSSHPLYMLTLSVKTRRGPTSIRIQYSGTQFLLDSSSPARTGLSSFPSVPSLVQHYMGAQRVGGPAEEEAAAEEAEENEAPPAKAQDASVVLKLKRAVYRPQGLPTLQHLTRLVINRQCPAPELLPLPRPLRRFIQDYPFKV